MSVKAVRVAEVRARDANRGIVRLDSSVMKEPGLTSGDAVEITGTEKAVGLVWPGYEADAFKGLEHWYSDRAIQYHENTRLISHNFGCIYKCLLQIVKGP